MPFRWIHGIEETRSELIKLLDKESAVEAINRLGEEDLRFLNQLIVYRLITAS